MPREYVDNAHNRRSGRVGMPVGSMVERRGSSAGRGNGGGHKLSPSSTGDAEFAGIAGNRGISGHGSTVASKSKSTRSKSAMLSPSKGNGVGNRGVGSGNDLNPPPTGSNYTRKSGCEGGNNLHPSSTKDMVYADKMHTRNIRCEGGYNVSPTLNGDFFRSDNLSCITVEESRPGNTGPGCSNNFGSSSTGVISNGRFPKKHTSSPSSGKSSSSSGYGSGNNLSCPATNTSFSNQKTKTHTDHKSVVVTEGPLSRYDDCKRTRNMRSRSSISKVYTDNTLNRRLGRVGKLHGTAVLRSGSTNTTAETYVDNTRNRALGRVGKPRGSMPVSRISKQLDEARAILSCIDNDTYDEHYGQGHDTNTVAEEIAFSVVNRKLEEDSWKAETGEKPKTAKYITKSYSGQTIDFQELDLRRSIGHGGFGDVYVAKWKGSIVAVKKPRKDVSKKVIKLFTEEVLKFCSLDHPNIVKFIGACVATPNLGIVMEYMQMSLHDAIFLKSNEIDFSEQERLLIIMQTCGGLAYLHTTGISHCDVKSLNILLDYEPRKTCEAKITDFGLSIMKGNKDTVCNIGTPRYSAPEVLRDESLSASDMMKSDVYSLSLVMYELIYENEPFYNLSTQQLKKKVGEYGEKPKIPKAVIVNCRVKETMELCWNFNASARPTVHTVQDMMKAHTTLYVK